MRFPGPRSSEDSKRHLRWIAAVMLACAAFAGDVKIRAGQGPDHTGDQDKSDSSTARTPLGRKAPEFTLTDQFRKSTTISYPSKSVHVFICADREGSKQVEDWVRRLYDAHGERVDIRGIALLKGVPAAVRSTVRNLFKLRVRYPVLLDWDGEATSQFPFKAGCACVIVVNPSGAIVAAEYGPVSDEGAKRVDEAIDEALAEMERPV